MKNLLFIGLMLIGANAIAQEVDYKLSINYGYNSETQSIEVTVYNNTWVSDGEYKELVYYPVGLLLDDKGDTIKVSDDRYYGIGDMSTFRFPLDEALTESKLVKFELHTIRFERLFEDWTFEISPDRTFTAWDVEPIEEPEVEERSQEDFDKMTMEHSFDKKSKTLTVTINSQNVKGFVSYPSLRVYDKKGKQIGHYRFDSFGLMDEHTFEVELDCCGSSNQKVSVALSEGHSTEAIRTWDIVIK